MFNGSMNLLSLIIAFCWVTVGQVVDQVVH